METRMEALTSPEIKERIEQGWNRQDGPGQVRIGGRYVLATDPVMSVTVRMQELSDWGCNGDPRGSNPELGKMFLEKSIEIIVAKYNEAIKNFPTEY